MKIYLFLTFFILLFAKDSYNSERIFNELINNKEFKHNYNYFIFDSNNYINNTNKLTENLKKIYNKFNVSIIIFLINKLDFNENKTDIYNCLKNLENDLINYNIFHKKSKYILFMISFENKLMSLKSSENLNNLFSNNDKYSILQSVNYFLTNKENEEAIKIFTKKILFYLTNTNYFSRHKSFFIFPLFLLTILFVLIIINYCIKRRKKLQLTMNDEEKLNKIREFLQKSKSDKNIITDNCIICLNPLNMDNNIDDPNNEYSISTLQCGHKYHLKCISEWFLKQKHTCPMCREKINLNLPQENNRQFQENLLRVQSDLHPAFALLAFDLANENLNWAIIGADIFDPGLMGDFGVAAFGIV
jgi:hypothetical protein